MGAKRRPKKLEMESDPPSEDNHSEEEDADSVQTSEAASSDEDSENEEDVTAIFKGMGVPEEGNHDDESAEEESDDDNGDDSKPSALVSAAGKGSEQCIFDLRNMLALNSHQVAAMSLYSKKAQKVEEENITIHLSSGHELSVDEDFLLSKATTGCTQLVHALFQLPTERSDAGPLVQLPHYDEIKLPRALVSYCFFKLCRFHFLKLFS